MGLFLKRERHREVDRREALGAVPLLNPATSIDKRDDDTSIVRVVFPRGPGFFERFRPPHMMRQFELDELGTFVALQIDGQKNVVGIIDAFVAHFKVNRREAEMGVVSFLKMLSQKGVASMISPEQLAS